MTQVIGLTGSIATGKSTVATMFIDMEIPVIDADKIARQVVVPGEKAYHNIIEAFGQIILTEDKRIDRTKLGEIVFGDTEKRKKLNSIIHPAIREEMLRQKQYWIEHEARAVVLDIPLLFESNLTHLVNKILVVYVDQATQLERLIARNNLSKKEALDRIHSQMSISQKVKMADAVIDNNGTIENSHEQLRKILSDWNIC